MSTDATTSDRLDKRQAAQAYAKLSRGETLSVREQSALKRFEKEREEELRWKYYATIPQKHWRTMSGRQTKVINEQATRYGLPFGGAVVSLPQLARSIHDFLAANAQKLAVEDPLLQEASSPALEQYRTERAALAKLDHLERERQLLPRDEARQALGRIAAILRGAADTLQRQFGQDACDILVEALADAEREIATSFGDQVDEEAKDGDESSAA